jgi:hypothetical protein
MNRRIQQEPQRHIHDDLCGELNEMSIAIKLHKIDLSDQSAIQQAKIGEARKRHPEPTWEDILSLIDRCRDEMDQCTEPYRLHR